MSAASSPIMAAGCLTDIIFNIFFYMYIILLELVGLQGLCLGLQVWTGQVAWEWSGALTAFMCEVCLFFGASGF